MASHNQDFSIKFSPHLFSWNSIGMLFVGNLILPLLIHCQTLPIHVHFDRFSVDGIFEKYLEIIAEGFFGFENLDWIGASSKHSNETSFIQTQ